MPRNGQLRAESDREPRSQAAAIPWRLTPAGEVEVLLITSRETRRWVIPKGWPIKGLTTAETATREAFEEAGVTGKAGRKKVGVYHYDKRLASGRLQKVKVSVFALKVEAEFDVWPELAQREKQWMSPADAAGRVQEPALAEMLLRFTPR